MATLTGGVSLNRLTNKPEQVKIKKIKALDEQS